MVDFHGRTILVNDVAVTSASQYSLGYTIRGLGLRDIDLLNWAAKQYKVLSVAEGAGALLPGLLDKGVNAFAMDLWYKKDLSRLNQTNPMVTAMREYQAKFSSRLIQGDARKMPILHGIFDRVVCHRLLNNLDRSTVVQVLLEMQRFLKADGEMIVEWNGATQLPNELAGLGFETSPSQNGGLIIKARGLAPGDRAANWLTVLDRLGISESQLERHQMEATRTLWQQLRVPGR